MADEITLQMSLVYANARNKVKREIGTFRVDQTGNNFHGPVKDDLGAAYSSLAKGDVGNLGWVILENPEADGGENCVVSFDNGVTDHLVIEPGEACAFRLTTGFTIANLKAKAATSASSIIYTIIED